MTLPNQYYGTIPSLAWILGHYFYGSTHFLYFASEFYPYRLENPRTSNPYLLYQGIYEPWRDNDKYDKLISGYRLSIIGGIEAKSTNNIISSQMADRLKRICHQVSIIFFYPIVCRINVDAALRDRAIIEGSGKLGSSEILFTDLKEKEIEILFLDFSDDEDFKRIVTEEYYSFRQTGRHLMESEDVLITLERRFENNDIQHPVSFFN
jgi:hypothetical protein